MRVLNKLSELVESRRTVKHKESQENERTHFNSRASGPKRRERVARRARDAGFRRVAQDGRLLAGRQLPVRRADLSLRQSAFARTADARPRKATGGRTLGYDAGPKLHLCAFEQGHQKV